MKRNIRKVAVLGSGVMGSGIACHMANVGCEVLLLDIVPKEAEGSDNKSERNALVNGALKAAMKSRPAPLYTKKFASRIVTGNMTDDMHKIADCDWIIEVVVERLDIKKIVFENLYTGYQAKVYRYPPEVYNRDMIMYLDMFGYVYAKKKISI